MLRSVNRSLLPPPLPTFPFRFQEDAAAGSELSRRGSLYGLISNGGLIAVNDNDTPDTLRLARSVTSLGFGRLRRNAPSTGRLARSEISCSRVARLREYRSSPDASRPCLLRRRPWVQVARVRARAHALCANCRPSGSGACRRGADFREDVPVPCRSVPRCAAPRVVRN